MPWPFDLGFMQRALVAGLIVGASAPLIGAFLVQKRLSLMGDGIGHVAFAGVAGGLLLDVWPVWSALAVAVAGALGVDYLRRTGLAGDLVLALFFYSGIAAGVVLVTMAGALNATVLPYLFGQIILVEPGEIWVIAALGAVIVAAVAIAGRALFAVVLDEEAARASGLPVNMLNALLSVLVALTVVVAMRVVGILLVAALMVLPVGASQAVARSFRATLLGASVVGMGSVVVGLTIVRAHGDLAPGGTIVLVSATAFAVAAIVTRRFPQRAGTMPHGPAVPGAPPPGGHHH